MTFQKIRYFHRLYDRIRYRQPVIDIGIGPPKMIQFALCFLLSCCLWTVYASDYDPSGRLMQVEYAYQATMKAGTIVAAKGKESILVFAITPKSFNYIQDTNRILPLTKKSFICGTGISSDLRHLTNELFHSSLEHSSIFHSDMPLQRLAEELATKIHEATLGGASRPYGTAFILFGETSINPLKIIEIDPMGNMHDCILSCIGKRFNGFVLSLLIYFRMLFERNFNIFSENFDTR
jgi:hypothetical protein